MAVFKVELVSEMRTTITITMSDAQAEDSDRRTELLLKEMTDVPKRRLPSGVWNDRRKERRVARLWRVQ